MGALKCQRSCISPFQYQIIHFPSIIHYPWMAPLSHIKAFICTRPNYHESRNHQWALPNSSRDIRTNFQDLLS
ncbi:hypothetical protein SK128_006116 [Halocaridina rubra]|uniref:Uncharacterized protein n=1 Tax=Halocaridina rubra TaxID=373956 RepID=A0AAN8WRV6_HALRR